MVGADVPGGPSPARNAAGRPTTEPRVGVGCRRARGTRAPTNVGAIVRQGQPTWEARADTPRRGRLGDFARRAVGGRLWIWPWVGCWSRAAPIRPRQARPSRVAEVQGTRDFTSEQFRRVDTRRVGARSTRAALGAGHPSRLGAGPGRDKRGPPVSPRCRRRGISRRNSSEVKSRIPKPAAGGPQLCGPQDLIAEAMTPFRLRFWP